MFIAAPPLASLHLKTWTRQRARAPRSVTHAFPHWCRGAAYAAKDNGGLCTYPYCGCYTDFNSKCLLVTQETVGQSYSFTITTSADPACAAPNAHNCTQDLTKIEINSCE